MNECTNERMGMGFDSKGMIDSKYEELEWGQRCGV